MDIPLTIAAAVFLAAYAWEVIADLSGSAIRIAEVIIAVKWVVFVFDYVVNLALARDRWHWFTRHLFDLLVVVLPMLRPLRLLRHGSLSASLRKMSSRMSLLAVK